MTKHDRKLNMLGHGKGHPKQQGTLYLPLHSPGFKSTLEMVIFLIAHWDFLSHLISPSKNQHNQ